MHYTIQIHHDPSCAWCYISHRTLLSALALFRTTYPSARLSTYTFRFLPFYRDRDAPDPSVPTWELMVRRNGLTQAEGIKKRMKREGRAVGVNFTLEGKVGRTRDYFRMLEGARMEGGEEGVVGFVERVYKGFFEEGADLTDGEFLVGCAVAVGVEEGVVRRVLESGRFGEEVDEMDRTARKVGVKAVPTTVINGVRVEGAEDVQGWYEVLVRVSEGDSG